MRKKNANRHAVLRIEAPEGRTWSTDLVGSEYVLGRGDPDAATPIDFEIPEDEFLSRAHLRLERGDGFYAVRNLSANGTVVNGRVIDKPVKLRDKDRIEAGGGTTLTYLLVRNDERKRLLSATRDVVPETAAEAKAAKAFHQRPVVVGILLFYVLLGVAIAGVKGKQAEVLAHPGTGPHFNWVLERPLRTSRPKGDAADLAERMWNEALALHGDQLLAEGDHAYQLLLEARDVAGILGYATLGEALAKGESFAQRAKLALDDLEKRVAGHLEQADQLVAGRHWALAEQEYALIAAAVPDVRSSLRQYVVSRIRSMRKKQRP